MNGNSKFERKGNEDLSHLLRNITHCLSAVISLTELPYICDYNLIL